MTNILTILRVITKGGCTLNMTHPDFIKHPKKPKLERPASDFVPVFIESSPEKHVKLSSVTLNEEQLNVSLKFHRPGNVTLPPNDFGFGETFPTSIWSTYKIISRGELIATKLPLILSEESHEKLSDLGIIDALFSPTKTVVIDLTESFDNLSGEVDTNALVRNAFALYRLKGLQKVLKTQVNTPEKPKFDVIFGVESAQFLSNFGITESGLSPYVDKAAIKEPEPAPLITVKLSSLSSIPKIDDVTTAIANGKKLTPSMQVLSDMIDVAATASDKGLVLKNVNQSITLKQHELFEQCFSAYNEHRPKDIILDLDLGKPIKASIAF
jgi:hypothetical protein